MLTEYISEFIWRQKHKGPDCFFYFWDMVGKIYPCETAAVAESDTDEEAGEAQMPKMSTRTTVYRWNVFIWRISEEIKFGA